MDVTIHTSDPDNVDPEKVKDALEAANFFVLSVTVNDGERVWESEMYHTGKHETEAELPPSPTLPDMHMQVFGTYLGDAYPTETEYEAVLKRTVHEGDWVYTLRILTIHDEEISSYSFGDDDADDIIRVASTDFSAPAADISVPIEGHPSWYVGDGGEHEVVLNSGHLDQIAAWLRFATGVETWDGGEVWEF